MIFFIFVGLAVSTATTLIHCALLGPLRWAVRHPWLVRPGRHPVWHLVGGMGMTTFLLTLAHMLEASVWALVYQESGFAHGWHEAYYDALMAQTSLGFNHSTSMMNGLQILEPITTLNGILLAGLSAAIMFAVLNLISQRQQPQRSHGA